MSKENERDLYLFIFLFSLFFCLFTDNKHTVFARCTKGMEVVQDIERVKTNKRDKPLVDIKIINITVE
jgi:cyclophilin family peptidyl-prolyl cis-trans isomerase